MAMAAACKILDVGDCSLEPIAKCDRHELPAAWRRVKPAQIVAVAVDCYYYVSIKSRARQQGSRWTWSMNLQIPTARL